MTDPTPQPASIYEAISIIQAEIPVLEKSAKNPHFGSSFTPLDDVAKRLYPRLRELGVTVLQPLEDPGQADTVKVKTILHHWGSKTELESVCVMPVDVPLSKQGKPMMNKQQAHGSTISYARRYSLTSILGIVCGHEDDDGGQPGESDAATRPSAQTQAGGNDQVELERFKGWLKSFAPTKPDLQALCAWLGVDEMPGLDWQKAITQVETSRAMTRALQTIQKSQGVTLEIIMANARDFHSKQQGSDQ